MASSRCCERVVHLAGEWDAADELRIRIAAAEFGLSLEKQGKDGACGGTSASLVLVGTGGMKGSAAAGLRKLAGYRGAGKKGRAAYPTKIWGCSPAEAFKLVSVGGTCASEQPLPRPTDKLLV